MSAAINPNDAAARPATRKVIPIRWRRVVNPWTGEAENVRRLTARERQAAVAAGAPATIAQRMREATLQQVCVTHALNLPGARRTQRSGA